MARRWSLLNPLSALVILILTVLVPAAATGQSTDFQDWLQGLRDEALARGISAETLDSALSNIAPIPRVVELDRRQPEFTMTFGRYLELVAPMSRIEEGRKRLAENRTLLEEIQAKFGVPPRFLVALWGIESNFGGHTGGFPVIAALATLAHDGRRSAYFRKELLLALQILEEGHILHSTMTGSWAGAMGQAQFMPSSFVSHAVDHDGDGRKDIWSNRGDIFASAANYLARSGWQPGYNWGRPVVLPVDLDPALAGLEIRKPLRVWQSLGLRRVGGMDLPVANINASVVIPDGPDGPAFLVYENFRVIMRWNRSTFFATAVGLLADRIGGL